MQAKATLLHRTRLVAGFALLGATVAGLFFGASEHAEIARGTAAVISVALAKAFHLA